MFGKLFRCGNVFTEKCIFCGSKRMYQWDLVKEHSQSDGRAYCNALCYVCLDCRQINLLGYGTDFEIILRREQLDKKCSLEQKELDKQKENIQSLISELEKTVELKKEMVSKLDIASKDENITIKRQKELLEDIDKVKNQISKIMSEIKEHQKEIVKLEKDKQNIKNKYNLELENFIKKENSRIY